MERLQETVVTCGLVLHRHTDGDVEDDATDARLEDPLRIPEDPPKEDAETGRGEEHLLRTRESRTFRNRFQPKKNLIS